MGRKGRTKRNERVEGKVEGEDVIVKGIGKEMMKCGGKGEGRGMRG